MVEIGKRWRQRPQPIVGFIVDEIGGGGNRGSANRQPGNRGQQQQRRVRERDPRQGQRLNAGAK